MMGLMCFKMGTVESKLSGLVGFGSGVSVSVSVIRQLR